MKFNDSKTPQRKGGERGVRADLLELAVRDAVAVDDDALGLDALVVVAEELEEVHDLVLHAAHNLLAVADELDAARVPARVRNVIFLVYRSTAAKRSAVCALCCRQTLTPVRSFKALHTGGQCTCLRKPPLASRDSLSPLAHNQCREDSTAIQSKEVGPHCEKERSILATIPTMLGSAGSMLCGWETSMPMSMVGLLLQMGGAFSAIASALSERICARVCHPSGHATDSASA